MRKYDVYIVLARFYAVLSSLLTTL